MARAMCQSCGMPLSDKVRGTEKDGRPSLKYCAMCYKNGKFIDPDITLEEIQAIGYKALRQKHWPGFLARMAVNGVPKLERWKKS